MSTGVYGTPRVPAGAVPRARLMTILDHADAIALVYGPGGSGKTTLLSQWASQFTDIPGVWVDAETAAQAFWPEVLMRLGEAGAIPARSLLAGGPSVLDTGERRILDLARGFRQIGPVVLVVDNAHLLPTTVCDELIHLVRNLPTLRLVIGTRVSEPWGNPGLSLEVPVSVIGPAELALTADEIGQVPGIPQDSIDRIRTGTGGLAVAIRAVALRLTSGQFTDITQEADARISAMLDALSAEDREFIERTVVADVFSRSLATSLAGGGATADRFDRFERSGLLVRQAGADAYSYVSVFRYAVRERERQRNPEMYRRGRLAVAQWGLSNRRYVEVIGIGIELADYDLVERAVLTGYEMLAQGASIDTAIALLSKLSLSTLRSRPVLAGMLGLCYNAYGSQRARAVALFAMAAAVAHRQQRTATGMRKVLLMTFLAGLPRAMGKDGLSETRELVAYLDTLPAQTVQAAPEIACLALTQAGLCYLAAFDLARADALFVRAIEVATRGDSKVLGLQGAALRCGVAALRFDLPQARQRIAEAERMPWPDPRMDSYVAALYRYARAIVAIERMDLDGAQRELDTVERHQTTSEHWAPIAYAQVVIRLLRGEAEQGLEELEALARVHRSRHDNTTLSRLLSETSRVLLYLAVGNVGKSMASARALGPGVVSMVEAWAALSVGDGEAALPALGAAHMSAPRLPLGILLRTEFEAGARCLIVAGGSARPGGPQWRAAQEALGRFGVLFSGAGVRTQIVSLPKACREAMVSFARETGDTLALEVLTDTTIPDVMLTAVPIPRLSRREKSVLRELSSDGTLGEIATRLGVSLSTVHSHAAAIYRKFGVSGRTEAVAAARELGFLERETADSH